MAFIPRNHILCLHRRAALFSSLPKLPLRSERKEAHLELFVAGVIVLIGAGITVALYLARRDPLTRDLNLAGSGLFILGRTSLRPRRDDDAVDRAPPAKQP
jgi:hypothetical protein